MMRADEPDDRPVWDALVGRDAERRTLDGLAAALEGGASRALVVTGQAGLGKSALLDAFARRVAPRRVLRVVGVESDLELAFAGVHQLCAPLLGLLPALPGPQRSALRVVFGQEEGPAPDRFLVGLAVLALLAEAATDGPVYCVVDDAQWLDRASSLTLAFVARRLDAESIAVLFGIRDVTAELDGLPRLTLSPLAQDDARRLLDGILPRSVDTRIRDRIVAETGGNPLDLIEFRHELSLAALGGGFAAAAAVGRSDGAEALYRQRYESLSEGVRHVLLLAAADPTGDVALLRDASQLRGLPSALDVNARAAGLVEIGLRVRFRHPLARAAVYGAATPEEHRDAHAALAAVTDPVADPDRRAWHRALSLDRPDAAIAAELERSAERAEARGGLSAAAVFLERSAFLSADPLERARRTVAAAQTRRRGGYPDTARELLAIAEDGPMRDADRARADLVRAQLDVGASWGGDTPTRLLAVARRLRELNPPLARMVHLEAVFASIAAGHLARDGGDLQTVLRSAAEVFGAPPAAAGASLVELPESDPVDGLSAVLRAAGEPGSFPDRGLRWFSLAAIAASGRYDRERWRRSTDLHLALCRRQGAVTELPIALSSAVFLAAAVGDLRSAASSLEELRTTSAIVGNPVAIAEHAAVVLAAMRGRASEFEPLVQAARREAEHRGEGIGLAIADWAVSVFENGRGHYETAATAARRAADTSSDELIRNAALVEEVEALTRSGRADEAREMADRLASELAGCRTDWGLGMLARTRALLGDPDVTEPAFAEAIERLDDAGIRGESARARLLRGEWLRRERRRGEARADLRIAREAFEAMGMTAFTERAARELWATGERAPESVDDAQSALTAQEARIARLAEAGLTNPEIGSRLFISARTVEYHLGKVFTKLGISARTQLGDALD